MGAVKESFLNNIPYREKFDDYGRNATRVTATPVTIHKTGAVVASEHSKAVAWHSAPSNRSKEGLGFPKTRGLC